MTPVARLFAVAAALALGATAHAATPAGLSRADLDTTCAPCRDFHRYANGGWLDRNAIPPTQSSWGSFSALSERNQERLRVILERAMADRKATPGSDAGKLGAYWCACMDSSAAGSQGDAQVRTLGQTLERLDAPPGLATRVAGLHDHGVGAMFAFRSGQDPRDSDRQIAFVGQGGLGLPDRDYYLRTDSASVATRQRYVAYLGRLFELHFGEGADAARGSADAVLALETSLAKASMTNVQRRDPVATYHKMSVDSLKRLCPGFDWSAYLAARGLATLDSINVTQPEFVRALDGLTASLPTATWTRYLTAALLADAAPMLGPEYAEADFRYQQALTGTQVQQPRWKRCLRWTDRALGDLLGQAYVKEHFPPASRARALELVHDLEAALADRIGELEWMGPDTRTRALEKLHAFEEKIGYPNKWRDYSGVRVERAGLLANHYAAVRAESRRNLGRIGKPVERGEWSMTPPTVNAFYSPSLNSINFPAGILQPPFFDPSWDDALNYGAIGAVIGHEMTHGFDDRGRQFDARGNLTDWWSAADAARYKERADKVAEQFAGYTVLDTLHLNGRLTLGENIADLGGIAVAYHAYQKAQARRPAKVVDGFTPEQRFFLAYARVWARHDRPAALRTQVQTNPHSPAVWRVNGPLSNLPEFQRAFGCRDGDAMVRAAALRARIW